MAQAGLTYKGLDEVEQHLRLLDQEAAYLIFQDRTDPREDETLGRFTLTMEAAAPWLSVMGQQAGGELPFRRLFGVADPRRSASPAETDGDLDDDLGEEDDEGEDDGAEEWPIILHAACWWVREMAARNVVGEGFRRFRVRVYGPKGVKSIYCGQFVCNNTDIARPVEPARAAPPPAPLQLIHPTVAPQPQPAPAVISPAEQQGVSTGMVALGTYYAQFGQLLLNSVSHLQGLSDGMMARMDVHLRESRGQVDQLVASFLEFRFKQVTDAEEANAASRQQEVNSNLTRNALSSLSDVAKAFVVTRGMPPETTELISALGTSPELMATLKEPDVQALMKDPANLRDLASLLKQAGQHARVSQGANNVGPSTAMPPTTPPPPAYPAPEPPPAQADPVSVAPSTHVGAIHEGLGPQASWQPPAAPMPNPASEAGAYAAWPANSSPHSRPMSSAPVLVPIGPSTPASTPPGQAHRPPPRGEVRDVPWPPGSSRSPSAQPGQGAAPPPAGQGSPPRVPQRS